MAGYSDVKSTFISDTVAADPNGYSTSAAVGDGAALTIGGALASGGSVTNSSGRLTVIVSAGDDSGISFTVVGTDVTGAAMTETTEIQISARGVSALGTRSPRTAWSIANRLRSRRT